MRGFLRSRRTIARRLALTLAAAGGAASLLAGSGIAAERIVGGTPIQIQSAPWAVFVQNATSSAYFDCSGSVLDSLHVLTAAHCVYDDAGNLAQPSQLSVTAGVSNEATPLSTDLEQDRMVSSFTVHPGYSYNATDPGPDDVAVIALASPLDLSGPAVKAVALPSPAAPFPSGAAVIDAGFGEETSGEQPSGQLNSLAGTIDPQGLCGNGDTIDDNAVRFCASSPTSATCHGDSGSGLVTTGSSPTLVGVLSAGPPGCTAGSHSTYTYVAAPEIFDYIQGNQQPPAAPREDETTFVNLNWDRPLVVGTLLTCSAGDWVGAPVSVTYSFVNGAGQVLQSGTRATYTLRASDLGATISCEGAATDAGGTDVVETTPTTPVKPAPQVGFSSLTPETVVRGKSALLVVRLKVPLGLQGTFSVCLKPTARVGGQVCRSLAKQQGGLGAGVFELRLWIKPSAPLGLTTIAISAVAGVSRTQARVPLRVTAAAA